MNSTEALITKPGGMIDTVKAELEERGIVVVKTAKTWEEERRVGPTNKLLRGKLGFTVSIDGGYIGFSVSAFRYPEGVVAGQVTVIPHCFSTPKLLNVDNMFYQQFKPRPVGLVIEQMMLDFMDRATRRMVDYAEKISAKTNEPTLPGMARNDAGATAVAEDAEGGKG